MNKQKSQWSNPYAQRSDRIKQKYGIDNNNNNNGKNAVNNMVLGHNVWHVQPIFNHPTALKSCLKINGKSKGVQKGKTKTLAQDRLQKIVKIDPSAVPELLKNHTVDLKPTVRNVLPKKYWSSEPVKSLKSNDAAEFVNFVKPAPAVKVDYAKPANADGWSKWLSDVAQMENVSKIKATTTIPTTFNDAKKPVLFPSSSSSSFDRPGNRLQTFQSDIIRNGHDIQVQNRRKINENSKIIGVDLKPTVKNVLPKMYWSSEPVKSLTSKDAAEFSNYVKPAQTVVKIDYAKPANSDGWPKWLSDVARIENVSKIKPTITITVTTKPTLTTFNDAKKPVLFPSSSSSFDRPGNGLQICQSKSLQSDIIRKGHDSQVQNRLKINDNSKIIGVKKLKSKTPAQDRLQKLVAKNKAAFVDSLKGLINADMEMIVPKSSSQRKSIGIQKSHVTGAEPSIIDIVNKSETVNGRKIDASAASVDAAVAASASASTYIIPDTNVFLNSLACIKNVIDRGLKHIIFVPYVVLQELDSLKQRGGEKNFTVKFNAKRAIRYIYELSTSDNKRLQGQSAIADKSHLIDTKSNDDRILNCCLQLAKQSKEVILVTNDLNLTNAAKFSGIETITQKRCMDKIQ